VTNKTPILSICIATYNRSGQLKEVLESIVKQEVFLNTFDIEIIISDNLSTDNTEEVSKEYVSKFPEKIIYHKNETNIGANKNYEKALSLSKGTFSKLHSDTAVIKENFLTNIVEAIKENIEEQPLLFFLNGETKSKEKKTICKNLNEFLKHTSYYCTWIVGFGLWRDDIEQKSKFVEKSNFLLIQIKILFNHLNEIKNAVVYNENFMEVLSVKNKGGYNVAEVFGKDYLAVLAESLKNGMLEKKIYQKEKKEILFNLIIPFYFDFDKKYNFQKTGYLHFLKDYKYDWFFYVSFLYVGFLYIRHKIKDFKKSMALKQN